MINLAHIINPVKTGENSDLFVAQPVTFESMIRARQFSKFTDQINLYTTQFEEDTAIIPTYFTQLSHLERSILAVNTELKGKKLPLIHDILEKAYLETDEQYIIYTNVDIALMPHFYDRVIQLIENGHDAILINRRRIRPDYKGIENLPEMYGELGRSHPGFDCFVFKRDLFDKFQLGSICIGISFLEVTLLHNLSAFAKKPVFILDEHLTFHLGTDVLVPRKKNPYYHHNRKEYFEKIKPQLASKFELKKFPYGNLPWYERAIKWGLNPSLFTRTYLQLEGKNFFQRVKMLLDEIRWRILQR